MKDPVLPIVRDLAIGDHYSAGDNGLTKQLVHTEEEFRPKNGLNIRDHHDIQPLLFLKESDL